MPKAPSRNRIKTIKCYCRYCWARLSFTFQWPEMEGWTMEDLRRACEYLHSKTCKPADVRIG